MEQDKDHPQDRAPIVAEGTPNFPSLGKSFGRRILSSASIGRRCTGMIDLLNRPFTRLFNSPDSRLG